MNGMFKADTNKDGVVTTEEFGNFAKNYVSTSNPLCDGDESCPIPDEPESSYFGVNGCDPYLCLMNLIVMLRKLVALKLRLSVVRSQNIWDVLRIYR